MSDASFWWIGAGILIALELFTGSFYLLMLALGMVAAAIAAQLGFDMTTQQITAAIVGSATVVAWYLWRKRHPSTPKASANPDVNMDIGEEVYVQQWRPDGTTQVQYRGAPWSAQLLHANQTHEPGNYRIAQIKGITLVLTK